MGGSSGGALHRARGHVEVLASGSRRVKVYAGLDLVTKTRLYLHEVIPAGPLADELAEEARSRLVDQVAQGRHPRTDARVSQMLWKFLDEESMEASTNSTLRGYVRKHIDHKRGIGSHKARTLDADDLESFYRELARCREHCDGKPFVTHFTVRDHTCGNRCRPHRCQGLANATIRKIHFLLSRAFKRALKWKWVITNPVPLAEPPAKPESNPNPPTPGEAVALVNEAWRDPDFGPLIWLAAVIGARRGELCALRWCDFQVRHLAEGEHDCLDTGCEWALEIRHSIGQADSTTVFKDTKTNQMRRIALDPYSAALLDDYRRYRGRDAASVGATIGETSFIFSPVPDGSTWYLPSSVSQKYRRLAQRLGIETTLHKLRHYSATELIAAGVDIRTVAGRLGHADASITLKVYAAWVAEADQRASTALMDRIPIKPGRTLNPTERVQTDPRSPYETVAAALHAAMLDGSLPAGQPLPPVLEIARTHQVSVGTAHRAITLLKNWGDIEVSRGRRAIVQPIQQNQADQNASVATDESQPTETGTPFLSLIPTEAVTDTAGPIAVDAELLHLGRPVRQFRTSADPTRVDQLERLLLGAVKRSGAAAHPLDEYELAIRRTSNQELVTTFVVSPIAS